MDTIPSTDQFPLHVRELLKSPRLGYVSAMSHLKRGFMIRKLAKPYGSAGGAGIYSHCLYDGLRGFCQITDAILEQLPAPDTSLAPLAFDETMLALEVPFDQKDAVKAAGADWLPMFRRWGCMPKDEAKFEQWLIKPICRLRTSDDLIKLNVQKEDIEKAKRAGAFWNHDFTGKGWYGLRGLRDRFIEWLY